MAHIRIAQDGWEGAQHAPSLDKAQIGWGIRWVEVDGVRVNDVIRADWDASGTDFSTVKLDVSGTLEIVYVDAVGDPLQKGS